MKDNVILFPDVWQDSMEDMYSEFTVDEIKGIARMHDIAGTYKYRKEELIRYVSSSVIDPDNMRPFFVCADSEELEAFELALYGNEEPRQQEKLAMMLSYFFRGGYVSIDGDGRLLIPEEVKTAYEQISTDDFWREQKNYETAYNYCKGLTALYGAVSLHDIADLYRKYEKKEISEFEIVTDIYLPSQKKNPYIIYRENMFTEKLLSSGEGLLSKILKERSAYKPYLPSKNEIQELAQGMDESFMIFGSYLMEKMHFSVEETMGVTELCAGMLKIGVHPEEVFAMLQNEGICFLNQEQADEFAEELTELWMNLRLYTLYGHTPLEVKKNLLD